MRLLIAIFVLVPVFGFSQSENDRIFMGFGIEGAFNLLDEPTLSFEEYQSVVGNPSFVSHSEAAELTKSAKLFTRNGIGSRFIFRGPDMENLGVFKKSRFIGGVQYNSGNNYTFKFGEESRMRIDTVQVVTGGSVQTLYRDTVFYTETEYSAYSRNLGLFAEYLISTGEEMPGFSIGLGLAGDVTAFYQAGVKQRINKETGLYDAFGNPVFADAVIDPNTGNLSYGGYFNYEWDALREQRLKMAYFIRPYIPVRLEASLSNRPVLSSFTVDINAKIGTEIQINPGASVNARMFYSLGLGLNYYFGSKS